MSTVDVLFPYYGDVALMKLAVQSVLRQSHSDVRLLVVDDGYPDDSIPGWFASLGDDRISYQRNETNLGANLNYRKAVSLVGYGSVGGVRAIENWRTVLANFSAVVTRAELNLSIFTDWADNEFKPSERRTEELGELFTALEKAAS